MGDETEKATSVFLSKKLVGQVAAAACPRARHPAHCGAPCDRGRQEADLTWRLVGQAQKSQKKVKKAAQREAKELKGTDSDDGKAYLKLPTERVKRGDLNDQVRDRLHRAPPCTSSCTLGQHASAHG